MPLYSPSMQRILRPSIGLFVLMPRWLAQNWFLLGLLAAVGLAFAAPAPGAPGGWLWPAVSTKAAVALIFFVQGMVLALASLHAGLWRWRLHVLVQGFSFLVIPLLGLALDAMIGRWLPDDLRLGVLFLAVLPTTVSSAVVFTSLAGGNTAGALVNATLSNLLGVVLTPLWVSVLLQARGEGSALWPMVRELVGLVLLPLLLGQLARLVVGGWADAARLRLNQLNSVLVLFIVYAAFCGSVQSGVWTRHGWRPAVLAFAISVVLFGAVCTLTVIAARLAGLSAADRIAALFCAPQKTLAAGAPMAKLIFATHPGLGLILLPVMFYHPLQLLVSGALVNVLKRKTNAETLRQIST
jgi:solute carrier family 10 (sodium/bile acid cotransporter), member 7